MSPTGFATLVLAAIALTTSLRLWLGWRQIRHVAGARGMVPAAFSDRITLAQHQTAADYTVARVRVAMVELIAETALLLALTVGGGLGTIDAALADGIGRGHAHGLALFAAVGALSALVGLPFSWYHTFRLESRFGFNRSTMALWLADLAKGAALAVVVGGPLLLAVLWLMAAMGERWWLYVWCAWLGFNLLLMLIYPTVIAPLFNKFTPLADGAVKQRIEALLARCGFSASGLFVMDGSRRSAHGNAYFTGFGRAKRIVFFDTLLDKLDPPEVEAVLAHELGHFRHRHVIKRVAVVGAMSLVLLWVLGQLLPQPWFFAGMKVSHGGTAAGLLLFSLILPAFTFPFAPLTSALSRRHEYEADAYAARQTSAGDLASALVKLYRDNAATLTPDILHSLFHDSHPPAAQRVGRLEALA